MNYLTEYRSPVGLLYLASEGKNITGLWIEGQKYFAAGLPHSLKKDGGLPVFRQAADWLNAYFSGRPLPALPPLAPQGSAFRQGVWRRLLEIPYGQTCTYGALAEEIGTSSRAVGGAVGRNPISILIPCHRVVGAGGGLTGYAGGVEKKRYLLELERVNSPGAVPAKEKNGAVREKRMLDPTVAGGGIAAPEQERTKPVSAPGKFPCPCCGYKTLPVPKEDAVAYICPVCFWENDVFAPEEDRPSEENSGMTLLQGRESYRRLGAVRPDLLPYVRAPLFEEIP